jgi:sulfatase maturation enzyme AslB (radical SAM superfamily)
MINLILTQVCNRRCQYCFARDMLTVGADAGQFFMERSMFEAALALAERSRAPEIRFLGGEPTLHPEFVPFAEKVLDRGLKLLIFSNGLIPPGPLQFLKSCTPEQVGLLVNVNDQSTYEPGEYDRLKERLGTLGRKVTCGYNISQPGFTLEPIIRLIPELNLHPSIRLGLAQPVLSSVNQHVNWADVPTIAKEVINAARLADPHDIILGLDCGFTHCMFRDYYGEVMSLRINFKCCCSPVLDLTPDGKIWYCLALWGHPKFYKLGDFPDLQSFRQAFNSDFAVLRSAGLLNECPDCKFRRTGQCSGGCFSRILQQWQ